MKSRMTLVAIASCAIAVSACNGASDAPRENAQAPSSAQKSPAKSPKTDAKPAPEPSGPGAEGESCRTSDASKHCLALRYVVYQDGTGKAVVSRAQANKNVKRMNELYEPCGVAFQIEEFLPVDPKDYGLAFNTANMKDLDAIRKAFVNPETLLIVTTGTWNRGGTLGNTSANAWTAMPGGGPFGAVLESEVGSFAEIIAHEMGHYLSLDHVSDQSDLMNPVIYSSSTRLTQNQCNEVRAAATNHWSAMSR